MEAVSLILSPIVAAMRVFVDVAFGVTDNFGIAIVLLSTAVRLLTLPIAKLAARSQQRARRVQAEMASEMAAIRSESRGRERFERTEALYKRHGYHPIHSVTSTLPLFLQLPFLLSALLLLSNYPPLAGAGFLFIPDLSRPDGLIAGGDFRINLLPLLITGVALLESIVGTDSDAAAKRRFLIIAVVIALLIYSAPAAVCLYWLTSNLLSFGSATMRRKPQAARGAA
jgi:YidC/Oxa1 family membrane protein insertase